MNAWVEMGISNGLAATLLAVVAALVARWCRRPQVAFALWLVVLAKLLVPPLVGVPLNWLPEHALRAVDARVVSPFSMPQPQPVATPLPAESELLAAAPAGNPLVDAPSFEAWELGAPPAPAEAYVRMLAADEALGEAPGAMDPVVEAGPPHTSAAAAPAWSLGHWTTGIGWLWLAGTSLWCALAAVRMIRFGRVLRRAEPAGADVREEVRALADRLGLARAPDVRLARRSLPPLVWAMSGRATMLLPADLLDRLSPRQRTTLLAHELVHVARRDHLVRWLELAAIGLYWWHPVAWWARQRLSAAEEQCCDARVVALLPGCARAYAEALLATVEFLAEPRRPLPAGASGFSQVGHIHRRLTMILERKPTGRLTWPLRVLLAAMALVVLPVSLHTLWAEPPAVAVPDEPAGAASGAPAEPAAARVESDVAAVAQPSAPPEPAEPAQPNERSVERRLERLERMIDKLIDAKQAESVPAGPARQPAEKRLTKSPLDEHRLDDLKKEVAQAMAVVLREHQAAVERMEASSARARAAERQVDAVWQAFETQTVASEELLDAIRRRAEAMMHYARDVSDLSQSPSKAYDLALAALVTAEQSRRDIKRVWEMLADRGAANLEIERAQRLYSLHESVAKQAADEARTLRSRKVDRSHYRQDDYKHLLGANPSRSVESKPPARATADEALADASVAQMTREEQENFEAERKLLEQATIALKAQMAARSRELEALEKQQRQHVSKLEDKLLELEARKAELEKRYAWEKGQIEELARQKLLEAQKAAARHKDKSPDKEKPRPADQPKKTDGAGRTRGVLLPGVAPVSWARLAAANEDLNDARKVWKAVQQKYQASGGREAVEEAQAREHYFEMKARSQRALYDCLLPLAGAAAGF
jgi:beta-lactamase regulating signal transducer with metallopeptidase domain